MRNDIDAVSFVVRLVGIIDEVSWLLDVGCNHFLQIFAHLRSAENMLSSVPFDVPKENDWVRRMKAERFERTPRRFFVSGQWDKTLHQYRCQHHYQRHFDLPWLLPEMVLSTGSRSNPATPVQSVESLNGVFFSVPFARITVVVDHGALLTDLNFAVLGQQRAARQKPTDRLDGCRWNRKVRNEECSNRMIAS